MPREWRPMRFFVRENGRLYPTILFWLFFIPVLAIVVGGGYVLLNRRAGRATVIAALTKTPSPTATETPAPTETVTPEPQTTQPTATEFVYDDPSDWEFVEKTDPTGKKYMDLQDWQKEQVWHAFGEFWNLLYHNDSGLPNWETVEPYVTGAFTDFARGSFDFAEANGKYLYLVEALEDVPYRAMVLHSTEDGEVKVRIVLGMDRSYQVQYRDPQTGSLIEEGKWLPYSTWSFLMTYQNGRWVIEQEDHKLFEE